MNLLTKENIAKVNKAALAEKHECSEAYVGQILRGEKAAKTDKAKAIVKDASEIIAVLVGKNPLKQETNV